MTYQGKRASAGIYTGTARYIGNPASMDKLQPGEVLVTKMTTPDWIAVFAAIKANGGGIITVTGGLTSHAAVVCREYGIPCVVGLAEAKQLHGKTVTMDGAKGTVEVHD